jgi:putative tricarboxylic transport membrane protein
MFEALGQGIAVLFQPAVFMVLILGCIVGNIVGVIPVLSGLMMLPLILPLIMKLPPEIGIGGVIAMLAVSGTGGSITSILLGIPGTALNSATVIDGYAMAKKGEASRAIGAALTSSMAGGVMGGIFSIALTLAIVPIILTFRTGDVSVLIVFALSSLAAMSSGSFNKGSIAALFGILLSLIGMHLPTGTNRFAFSSTYLYDGLDIIPVTVGLFGLAAVLDMILEGRRQISESVAKTSLKDILKGVRDVWIHRWLLLRSTIIGYLIGIMPGAGGVVALWTAYAQAKQLSKHPELFGQGNVEGVIAPECADNACRPGDLLVSMVFGIPGSATMAILLVAFFAVGVIPGPIMIQTHLPLVFTLLTGVIIANIIGAAMCFPAIPALARVSNISISYLFPAILVIIFFAVYVNNLEMLDIFVTIIFGLLGLTMMKLDYSRPAFILGFVLGSLFERYTTLALKLQGPLFWTTPISLTLLFLTLFCLAWPFIRRKTKSEEGDYTDVKLKPSIVFAVFCLAFGLFVFMTAIFWQHFEAKFLPLLLSGIMFVFGMNQLRIELTRKGKTKQQEGKQNVDVMAKKDGLMVSSQWRRFATAMMWMTGLVTGIYLFGFLLSSFLFSLIYVRLRRCTWFRSILFSTILIGSMYLLFVFGLRAYLYKGLLFSLFWQ